MSDKEYVREYRSWVMALVEVTWDGDSRTMMGRVYARVDPDHDLFLETVTASPTLVERWYSCSSLPGSRLKVWRRVPKGQDPPQDRPSRKMKEPEDWEDLAEKLYDKLRLGYANITERASFILLSAAAAEEP